MRTKRLIFLSATDMTDIYGMLYLENTYFYRHKVNCTIPAVPFGHHESKQSLHQTLILDATCAPVNIRYPQDVSLLNEAREKLETIIYRFCKAYGLKLPRRYARAARRDYLKFAKARKNSRQKIRKALRRQLSYVGCDIKYLEGFMAEVYKYLFKFSVLSKLVYVFPDCQTTLPVLPDPPLHLSSQIPHRPLRTPH